MSEQYRKAGVNIAAGDAFVERIKVAAQSTHGPQVLGGIGGFAAHVALDLGKYKHPVLVTSTDGVGTKLRVAIEAKRVDTIGQDLVAMCANDLACSGATPLCFLDYFATGKLLPAYHATIIEGIATACRAIGCALVGGETAEMPGMYHGDDFDLAGFVVGLVERDAIINGQTMQPGHAVIGVASSGFHSNGYALIRQTIMQAGLARSAIFPGTDRTVADVLLTPTALYSPLVHTLLTQFALHGIAHITGGGLTGNIPRIVPPTCQVVIDWSHWKLPAPFAFVQQQTNMPDDELRTVLNCGVGLVLMVDAAHAAAICESCAAAGHAAHVIGHVAQRDTSDAAMVYR